LEEDIAWQGANFKLGSGPQIAIVICIRYFSTSVSYAVFRRHLPLLINANKLVLLELVMVCHYVTLVLGFLTTWALVPAPLRPGGPIRRAHCAHSISIMIFVRGTRVVILCAKQESSILISSIVIQVRGVWVKT
jgi:hypothetical protein